MPRIHALFCLCVCALSVCFVVFFRLFITAVKICFHMLKLVKLLFF